VDALREALPGAGAEVLVPDFLGKSQCVEAVAEARPDVFAHNVETVEALYAGTRDGADYSRSLSVLECAGLSRPRPLIKSSLMLGMGETREQLDRTLGDMLDAGVDIVTLGQYLRPSSAHRPVDRFVTPEEFAELSEACARLGFDWVSSGPFVRSSFRAEEAAAALGAGRIESKQTTQEAEPDED
jgi:lipoic acid synthetase